jgi:hypothetical protein
MAANVTMWRKHVCEAVDAIADLSFQRDAWFGRGRYRSSPEEIYNQLFDDAVFEEFLQSADVGLNDLQRLAGQRLVEKMNFFDKLGGPSLPARVVIEHPVWKEVREAARRFLSLLPCNRWIEESQADVQSP